MSENSKIEWTDHTFNPWRGCTKVSEGCANCYAAVNMSVNLHGIKWGPRGERVVKAESGWREPIKWNANARTAGKRARVFCASLADVFEAADTMPAESWPMVQATRLRLLRLIFDTPHLDWLLLTKRPENIVLALTEAVDSIADYVNADGLRFSFWLYQWIQGHVLPPNVWLGTSVENQEQADIRVPQLLAAPAAVRFLSCEPLLGPVSLAAWLEPQSVQVSASPSFWQNEASRAAMSEFIRKAAGQTCGLHWVIVGGESGPKARPMHPDWARGLRDQCQAAGVPFLFKQWGQWENHQNCPAPVEHKTHDWLSCTKLFPDGTQALYGRRGEEGFVFIDKVGKHEAGRLLDGQEYNEFPSAPAL